MGTQKPGEWANSLIARFEEQVSFTKIIFLFILGCPTPGIIICLKMIQFAFCFLYSCPEYQ